MNFFFEETFVYIVLMIIKDVVVKHAWLSLPSRDRLVVKQYSSFKELLFPKTWSYIA